MTAEEIVGMIRDNVQIYDINPLKDGFPDDEDNQRRGPSILPWVKRVQRDLARLGCYYGKKQFTLPEGDRSVCVNGSLLHVYQVTAEDESGNVKILEPFSRFREDHDRPQRYNDANARVKRYDFFGRNMEFDKPADQDYIITILTDSLYTPLAERGDSPDEIDEINHDVFVDGGTYYIGTQALNMPQNRDSQSAIIRYQSYVKQYEALKEVCKEVARARMANDAQSIMINDPRQKLTGYAR